VLIDAEVAEQDWFSLFNDRYDSLQIGKADTWPGWVGRLTVLSYLKRTRFRAVGTVHSTPPLPETKRPTPEGAGLFVWKRKRFETTRAALIAAGIRP
jgi:hypothetical protein